MSTPSSSSDPSPPTAAAESDGRPLAGTRPSWFAIRPRLAVGLVAVTAFFIRILHVVSYDPAPTNDMAVYVDMAVRRLSLKNLFTLDGLCWFPPGYAFFLKPFFLALAPEAALRAVLIAQAALGAWTCVLLYRLARRLHSRRAGLAAAVIACFFPHFLFYSSVYMSEGLFTALFFASLLLFLRAADRPGPRSLYRAGLVAGAAALVRPVEVSLVPAAILAAWKAAPDRKGRLRALALLAAGGLTLMGPWAIRNGIAYKHFVLIAPNSAFNLAIGNHPNASGRYTDPPSIVGNIWSRMEYFQGKALDFVTNDPWGALFVVLRLKWHAFWELIPPWPLYSSNPRLFYGEIFFPYFSWRSVFFLGLAGAGALLSGRKSRPWLTPLCFTGYVAFYMMFFGGARFRLPAEGFFIAWAGVAVASVIGAVPRLARARAPRWAVVVALGICAALAQAGATALSTRAYLRSPESLIAMGEQFPVLVSRPPVNVFGDEPIPLDRSRGRFVKMGFTAFRQGPGRDAQNNGFVKITFLDHTGKTLSWLDNPAYFLEALPADRWVTVAFRAHIPPSARSCQVTLTPERGSPDTLIIDQPILRYSHGNDLALESVFSYLRYEE